MAVCEVLSPFPHLLANPLIRYSNTIDKFTGHEDLLEKYQDIEADLIVREINQLGKALMFNEHLTVQDKEEVVTKIGHMAYMGKCSVSVGKCR